ncbi:MAG: VanW family protein [Fimbriimonadaceae bacterium]|nr:VanW family protein [Fimbriimonadaceae bacterium]
MKAGLLLGAIGLTAVGGASFLATMPAEVNCIAKFTTSLDGRTPNQRHNAQLALRSLNGAVVKPGETFSFCKRVGTWSRDTGYRKAPVSYNGQLVDSWGGGVCQASTTLYNAALVGGMDVTQRSKHRFWPSYAPPGRDAAVAYQNIDLKFKNPYDFPITIRGQILGDRLEIGLYGRGEAVPCTVVSEVHEKIEPSTYRLPGKQTRVRNSGKPGFEVTTLRKFKDRTEFISSDTYPPMNRVEEFGS